MGPEPPPEPPPTVIIARSSRALRNATAVVISLLVLAVLKPWGASDTRPDSGALTTPAVSPAVATPPPTPDLSADGLAAPLCLAPGSWLVASLEQWRTRPVRVWKVIEPIRTATGPTDPAIPSVPVVAYAVHAVGWCAPVRGVLRPSGLADVTAWRIADRAAVPITLRQIAPERLVTPFGALYGPPEGCLPVCPSAGPSAGPGAAPAGSWQPGRYVFRYDDTGLSEVLWLAAEVELLPPPPIPSEAPSEAPSVAPG